MSKNDTYQLFCKSMKSKEAAINHLIKEADKSKISDGHHTFGELYAHRNLLFINMCKLLKKDGTLDVWRSIKHSDGSIDKEFFIMGVNKTPEGQVTYHLPIEMWESTMWADTLDKAPEYNGYSSSETLTRLKTLI